MVTDTSLAIVTVALEERVESALLVAVTCTTAGNGKSAGAPKTPPAVIVPAVALPPVTPLTLHVTLVSLAFVTVAAKLWVFPRSIEELEGFTVTPTDGGGGVGGGAADPVPPPTQPCVKPAAAKVKTKITSPRFALAAAIQFCGRGRMPFGHCRRKASENRLGFRPGVRSRSPTLDRG
jgi:hypothetical protein